MSRVTITAIDAELLARKIGGAAAARVRRKAVNEAGKGARKDLPPLIAEAYSTSRAGVGAKGRAASPGSEDPIYTLRLNRKIRLAKLKASARTFKARRSEREGTLTIAQGPSGRDRFRALRGEGRGEFILPARAGRKRRRLGGVPISLKKDRRIAKRRERIGEDLRDALMAAMEESLKRRTR